MHIRRVFFSLSALCSPLATLVISDNQREAIRERNVVTARAGSSAPGSKSLSIKHKGRGVKRFLID